MTMSFWNQFAGGVDGSAEKANLDNAGFSVIPGGTKAIAMIEGAELSEYQGVEQYELKYKIVDGEFKNRLVFHKIRCFDPDAKKAARAANVLYRMFQLCELDPPTEKPQTAPHMIAMVGKLVGIEIEIWEMDGRDGNWVSGVHPTAGFECVTGTKMPKGTAPAASPAPAADKPLW